MGFWSAGDRDSAALGGDLDPSGASNGRRAAGEAKREGATPQTGKQCYLAQQLKTSKDLFQFLAPH